MTEPTVFLLFLPSVLAGIVTQPQRFEVVEGRHASLPCTFEVDHSNDTTISWAWRPLNRNVSLGGDGWQEVSKHFSDSRVTFRDSGNNGSLTIYGVRLAEAGEYQCSVFECYGKACCQSDGTRCYGGRYTSVVHNLTVAAPPYVKGSTGSGNETHTVRVNAGRSMRLFCVVTGKSPISVKWYIGGEPLVTKSGNAVDAEFIDVSVGESSSRNRRFPLHRHHFFERSNMSSLKEGTYKCEATNELGADEISYSVKVTEPPAMDRSVEQLFKVAEGEEVTLTCRLTSKPTPLVRGQPIIRWFHNGVFDKAETQSTDASVYSIPKATAADGGKYSCIATNDAGTASIEYTVLVAPKVSGSFTLITPFAEVRVPLNSSFALRCNAMAYPPADIQWIVDGQPIHVASSDEKPYTVSNGGTSLNVKNFSSKRALFECRAKNSAGSAQDTFVVGTLT